MLKQRPISILTSIELELPVLNRDKDCNKQQLELFVSTSNFPRICLDEPTSCDLVLPPINISNTI